MPNVISGFQTNPAPRLEAAFQAIAAASMRELPFFHPQMPIRACGFQLFEQQWIGCMLTPWMLSLMVLPGPQQQWAPCRVGEKLALALPCGNVNFTHGHIDDCGHYLACSLMSPLENSLGAEQAQALAENSVRMVLSLPVVDNSIPSNPGRRALFRLPRGN
ncbi:hydrogenase [Chania multitudinisentens RB-25]|uniref:Hydrogenase n=1 Tax=Chania multitudinisentens RB-25 TaxID=1441930 RepID=W0L493_9GAMM|nr:hydrogenase-2 assembly chaperone [Chania multitudinisentens]AHG18511.1 hydrogenase [Chania multitudinisentens RB-25]